MRALFLTVIQKVNFTIELSGRHRGMRGFKGQIINATGTQEPVTSAVRGHYTSGWMSLSISVREDTGRAKDVEFCVVFL